MVEITGPIHTIVHQESSLVQLKQLQKTPRKKKNEAHTQLYNARKLNTTLS